MPFEISSRLKLQGSMTVVSASWSLLRRDQGKPLKEVLQENTKCYRSFLCVSAYLTQLENLPYFTKQGFNTFWQSNIQNCVMTFAFHITRRTLLIPSGILSFPSPTAVHPTPLPLNAFCPSSCNPRARVVLSV